jgi:NADP-dependent 3-hydroxy acid dehydrogenase YdfG
MVNNAGGITAPAADQRNCLTTRGNDLQWNLSSVFYGTKHAFAHMLARGSGSVINISSWKAKPARPVWQVTSPPSTACTG